MLRVYRSAMTSKSNLVALFSVALISILNAMVDPTAALSGSGSSSSSSGGVVSSRGATPKPQQHTQPHAGGLGRGGGRRRCRFRSAFTVGSSELRRLVMEASEHDANEALLDVKGIMWLEHVNLVVGTNQEAEAFYMDFLGLTRDDGKSFHVNLGQQQFHLADEKKSETSSQRIAGSLGLAVPSLETIRKRLPLATERLGSTTRFDVGDDGHDDCMTLTCPWGNTIHLYSTEHDSKVSSSSSSSSSSPQKMVNLHAKGTGSYGSHRMAVRGQPGIRFVEIICPPNTSNAIAKFYRDMLRCTVMETQIHTSSTTKTDDESSSTSNACVVCAGPGVHLVYVEPPPDVIATSTTPDLEDVHDEYKAMEGVHVCVYADDFRGLYRRLSERDLIYTNPRFVHLDTCDTWDEAAASRTLRFKDIIDLDTGEKILELEHETRPLRHGQYLKVPRYEPK